MAHTRCAGRLSSPRMNLIQLRSVPILQQLHMEERMLRASSDNWCIVNDGTDTPTIVMGISGKPSELIEVEPVLKDNIPVIKRFSGGGTVIVDDGTIFVTFICNKDAVPGLQLFPRNIMSWTGQLYSKVFGDTSGFHLRENDYAFGDRKFGGNAQSITKNRWLHHTSFLWDYESRNMEYLKVPPRTPAYRLARSHANFICPLKEYLSSRADFVRQILTSLEDHFCLNPVEMDSVPSSSTTPFTCTSKLIEHELQSHISAREIKDQVNHGIKALGAL